MMEEFKLLTVIEDLRKKLKSQADEIVTLTYQRDLAESRLLAHVPVATPEEEAEFLRSKERAIPGGLADLIRELEQARPGGE